MTYPAYPNYKRVDSHWVEQIPSHWFEADLKHYARVKGGFAFNSESFTESGKPVIRIGDIKADGSVSLESCKFVIERGSEKFNQYEVKQGDLLMAMTGATIGKAGWYNEARPALLNQRVGAFFCNEEKLNYRFFWYVLNSFGYQEYIRLTAFGGAQPNISDTGMVEHATAFPPLSEQTQIAAFLDRETAKIDQLIDKQQQLIKLLEEKRQAVISHAVTKGLNPDAPMKDSGVEWLGEVPEHWSSASISAISHKITNGYVGPTRDIFVDAGVPYLQSLHIKNNKIKFHTPYYVRDSWSQSKSKSILNKGDVLVVQTGDIGQVAVVPDEFSGCNCHALIIISPMGMIQGEYLSLVLNSTYGYHSLKSIQTGALHPHLNCGTVKTIKSPLPPIKEQEAIIAFIDSNITKIDKLKLKASRAIELMKERRTALISAAVTGKIDVRNTI